MIGREPRRERPGEGSRTCCRRGWRLDGGFFRLLLGDGRSRDVRRWQRRRGGRLLWFGGIFRLVGSLLGLGRLRPRCGAGRRRRRGRRGRGSVGNDVQREDGGRRGVAVGGIRREPGDPQLVVTDDFGGAASQAQVEEPLSRMVHRSGGSPGLAVKLATKTRSFGPTGPATVPAKWMG